MMERYSDQAIEIINELHTERLDYNSEYLPLIDCANRCKAYEDTGLEPEQIVELCKMDKRAKMADLLRLEEYQALGPVEHLRELVEAEKQGMLVHLPCKVGNTVYEVTKGLSIYSPGLTPYILETVVISVLQIAKWVINGDFGKTVFLNREDAEAALKGGDAQC